jgi:hypothetical protein
MKTTALVLSLMLLIGCSPDKDSTPVFLAKEMCSCRFLVGQSEQNCRSAIRLGLAMGDVTVDYKKQEVTATAEDKSHPATFQFINTKLGCALK